MALTSDQRRQTHAALHGGFTPKSLDALTTIHLRKPLYDIVPLDNTFEQAVARLIDWCDQRGQAGDLIVAAHADLPGNPAITQLWNDSRTWDFSPASPTDARFPLRHGLTALPAYHVARVDELARLNAALAAPEVALTALEGLGGVGKSTLALEYCLSDACKARFPDGVLWGRLGPAAADEAAADSVLLAWGEALRLDRDTFARMAPADKAATLRTLLGARRVLLVVDDMWHAPPARLLQGARGPHCAVLITTRDLNKALALGTETVRLDTLTRREAFTLLCKRLKRELRPGEPWLARELIKRVGYHPLAVQLAGAQLSKPGRTFAAILAPLRAQQGEIAPTLDLDRAAKESSLATCFDWSYNGLDAAARRAYRLLGVLAPEAPFDVEDAGWLWWQEGEEIWRDAVQRTLNALTDAALLEAVAGAGGATTRYRQHLLLRDDARRRLRAAGEFAAALLHHAQIYVAVADSAAKAATYKPIARAYPQVEAVLRRAWRPLRPAPDDAGPGPAYPPDDAWQFLNSLCYDCYSAYWGLAGRPLEELRWLPRAAQTAHGRGMKRDEGAHLNHLGLAYASLGRVQEAIKAYEQALPILRVVKDRRSEGAIVGNLGAAYYSLGRVAEAVGTYEQALAIARAIGDRRGEGNRLGNLGLASADLGRVEEAVGFYEQALAIAREIGDRRGEGADLGNLGRAYAALGRVEEAVGYHEQALAIRREIGDRRGEGNDLTGLGNASYSLGRVEEAIRYYEQALAIARAIGDRRGEGNDLGNLGLAYADLGRVEEALGFYEQALAIARAIGDRRGEGNHLGNLGNAYADLGRVEEAVGYFEQALAIARAIGDPAAANHLANLGIAYEQLGRTDDARRSWEEALRIYTAIKSPHAETVRGWLAQSWGEELRRLLELGAGAPAGSAEAAGSFGQALDLLRQLGERGGEAQLATELASAAQSEGRGAEAVGYYERALAATRAAGDPASVARALRNLVDALIEFGQIDAARAHLEEAAALAPDHPFTHARLAQLAFAEGGDAAALEHYARAAELNADDPTEFHFDRAMPLLRQGRADEALGLIRARLAAFDHPPDLEDVLRRYRRRAEQEPGVAGLGEAIALLAERAARAAGGPAGLP